MAAGILTSHFTGIDPQADKVFDAFMRCKLLTDWNIATPLHSGHIFRADLILTYTYYDPLQEHKLRFMYNIETLNVVWLSVDHEPHMLILWKLNSIHYYKSNILNLHLAAKFAFKFILINYHKIVQVLRVSSYKSCLCFTVSDRWFCFLGHIALSQTQTTSNICQPVKPWLKASKC